MGCPDWPLCYGQIIPPLDDYKAWWEWIHRTIAAVIGFLILGVAFFAWKDHRDRPSILWPSLAAVALVVFQAWLGRETVRMNNSGDSVTAHLAAAMALLGLLVYVTVRAFYPARLPARGGSQRFTLLAVLTAATMFVLLLFGSNVTAQDAGARVPGLAADERRADPDPGRHGRSRSRGAVRGARAPPLRRRASCWLIVWVTAFAAWRTQRDRRAVVLAGAARWASSTRSRWSIGGLQVFTLPRRLDPDAPRRAQRAALGPGGGARDHAPTTSPAWRCRRSRAARRPAVPATPPATRLTRRPRLPQRTRTLRRRRPAPPARHASAPTSR